MGEYFVSDVEEICVVLFQILGKLVCQPMHTIFKEFGRFLVGRIVEYQCVVLF
jgi:hypothetical protein